VLKPPCRRVSPSRVAQISRVGEWQHNSTRGPRFGISTDTSHDRGRLANKSDATGIASRQPSRFWPSNGVSASDICHFCRPHSQIDPPAGKQLLSPLLFSAILFRAHPPRRRFSHPYGCNDHSRGVVRICSERLAYDPPPTIVSDRTECNALPNGPVKGVGVNSRFMMSAWHLGPLGDIRSQFRGIICQHILLQLTTPFHHKPDWRHNRANC